MPNWYVSLEQVKRAGAIFGSDKDAQISRIIEAVSRQIDNAWHRRFIPETDTKLYRWPYKNMPGSVFWLPVDLISITTLQVKAQDTTPTTIAAADYFLEPQDSGPPYNRIEIDLSSTAAFESGNTPQRSLSIAGSWGYRADTETAGTVSSGLATDAAATSMVCSDGSLIGAGQALLIQSEQVFVSKKTAAALGAILLNGALTASVTNVTVTVDAGHGVIADEVIKVESEDMLVISVVGNNLTVIRGYNGTLLATHADDTAVSIYRTLTIVRAVNGTTAATHANATAISKYAVPYDVQALALAETIAVYQQEASGWGRTVGTGDGAVELSGRSLAEMRKRVGRTYRRMRHEAI